MREPQRIGPGIEFIGFDSPEEFTEWLAQSRAEVQARKLSREQEEILYGSHAVRFYDTLTIFLWIPLLTEWTEPAYVIRRIDEKANDENLMYGWGYSTAVTGGELGYTHRSVMWPISDRCFEAARVAMWNVANMPGWARTDLAFAVSEFRGWLQKGKK